MTNRPDWVVHPSTFSTVGTSAGGSSFVMTPSETLWLPLTAWQGLSDSGGDADTNQRIAYPETGGKHLALATVGAIHFVYETDPGAIFTDMWSRSWMLQQCVTIQPDHQVMTNALSVSAASQTRPMTPAAANMDYQWKREWVTTNIAAGFWSSNPPMRTPVVKTLAVNAKYRAWLDPPEILTLVIDVQQYVVNVWESMNDLLQIRVIPRLRTLVVPL